MLTSLTARIRAVLASLVPSLRTALIGLAIAIGFAAPASAATFTRTFAAGSTVNDCYGLALGSGGPYTYNVVSGSLPTGITFNLATGSACLVGSPTNVALFQPDVRFYDNSSTEIGTSSWDITITAPALAMSPSGGTLTAATQNVAYSRQITASGGTSPYGYQITAGALPAGLSLNPSTGLINGTPTSTGTFNFSVTATDSTTGSGSPFSVTGAYQIIVSPPPSLSINDVSANEGNSGTTNFTFTVSLSAASTNTVTVSYATGVVTAVPSSDFTNTTGTLTFAPGETTKTVTVLVNGDTVYEINETFVLNLSGATNASIADNQGLGTILNDDAAPTLTINDVTASEAAGTVTFTVTGSGATQLPITVNYATADGTAVSTGPTPDYTSASGTLTFLPSLAATQTQTFTVALTNDAIYEAVEQFAANLSNAVNATIADAQGIGTITDDDAAPTLAVNDVTVSEGAGSAFFTVTINGATALPIAFNYSSADGTATAPADYIATSGSVTFNPSTSATRTVAIPVALTNDSTNEATEQFALNLSGPTNGATITDAQGVATVTDDDAAPTMAIGNAIQAEGNSGTTAAVFAVTLSVPSAQTITVQYTTADNFATVADNDYVATSGTLTFAPGETAKNVTVSVVGDTKFESDETYLVNLFNITNGTFADAQGTGGIVNDDTQVTFTPASGALTGGQIGVAYSQQFTATGGNGGPYTFSVTAGALPSGITLSIGGLLSGTPNGSPGTFNFSVTATDTAGNSGVQAYALTIQQAAPTFTSIAPNAGPTAGGQAVTITGTNFVNVSSVTIGGVAATGVVVNSATSISATTPAHAAGAVNVVVTTPGGTATGTNAYTYQAPGAVRFVINNPDDGSYVFTSPTAALNFTVTTSGGTGSSANISLAPGSYSVSFTTPAGTGLTSAACAPVASTVNTSARTAALVIASNVTTVCTIEALPSRRATVEAIGAALDAQSRLILANAPTLARRIDRLNGGGGSGDSASAFGKTLASNLPFSADIGADTARFSMSLSGLRKAGSADHRFNAPANDNGVPASLAASVTPASGLAATAAADAAAAMSNRSGPRFDIWVEGLIARFDAAANSDGNFAIVHAGADYLVTPNLLVGVGIQGDWLDMDTSTGKLESSGFLAGPYLTARISENLYLDARAAWGGATLDVSPFGTYTDQVDSDRALYSAALIGEFSFSGDLTVRPEARVSWYKETTDAYVDSLSVAIPSVEIKTGEVTLGPDFVWTLTRENGGVFSPHIGFDLVWTFQQDNTATAFTNAPGLDDTGIRGRVEGGLSYLNPEGIEVGASVFYDGIGGGDYSAYGATAKIAFGF